MTSGRLARAALCQMKLETFPNFVEFCSRQWETEVCPEAEANLNGKERIHLIRDGGGATRRKSKSPDTKIL